jgi:hypothetical protein
VVSNVLALITIALCEVKSTTVTPRGNRGGGNIDFPRGFGKVFFGFFENPAALKP